MFFAMTPAASLGSNSLGNSLNYAVLTPPTIRGKAGVGGVTSTVLSLIVGSSSSDTSQVHGSVSVSSTGAQGVLG